MAQVNTVHTVRYNDGRREIVQKVREEDLERFKTLHDGLEVVDSYELQAQPDPAATIETEGALATQPDANVQSTDDKKRQSSKKG